MQLLMYNDQVTDQDVNNAAVLISYMNCIKK